MATSNRNTKVTIDHDEIRRWAEARGARPAVVRGTNIIRLDFPGFTGEDTLQPISWDEWFKRFDESKLALVYQEKTSQGQRSNFNKLVGRETIDLRTGKLKAPPRRRAKEGARTPREAARLRRARAKAPRARRAAKPKRARAAAGAKRARAATGAKARRGAGTSKRPSRGRTRGTSATASKRKRASA